MILTSQFSRRAARPFSNRRFLDAPLGVAVPPPHHLTIRLGEVLQKGIHHVQPAAKGGVR